ncbi:hypothetical protein [Paenarthrobacter aurescens]|jgi:hypothetical protein|uniref:Integral membrane protein n=1 Tax=Paenarthrobacter aurescens (strain TC1) TaxID=290340 RepID=A1RAQ9_PAEAT|nr:hypothetical protein [Paenarthrobacter aurescens]ABM09184.1 putative integral membrane protein [Paenarthrobacter aurescens TC1]
MKKSNQWSSRIFYAGVIIALVVAFVWMARSNLPGASPFFALGAAYTFLLFREVPPTSRASMVMLFGVLLISLSLTSAEDDLGVPAAASWLLGFMAGAIASGYPWLGERPRPATTKKGDGNDQDGEGTAGGRRPVLINGTCVAVLLAAGLAHLIFQNPTAPVAAVLAGALVCGWALFRFPPSALTRNMLLLVIPVEFFLLIFVAGNIGQPALPFVWTYGALAGILLGGTFWSGPRRGTPRPPFSGQIKRRRKRKKVRRSQDKLKQKQLQNEAPAVRR